MPAVQRNLVGIGPAENIDVSVQRPDGVHTMAACNIEKQKSTILFFVTSLSAKAFPSNLDKVKLGTAAAGFWALRTAIGIPKNSKPITNFFTKGIS